MKFVPDSSVVADIIPSANYGERRNGRAPDMIVLHYTGMADAKIAVHRLTTVGTEVSTHYIVYENGRIVQSVPESKRAWHAGAAAWAGETDINSCSIGVEIINGGHDYGLPPYPLRQIAAVITLCKGIMIRRNIPRHRVLGHSDVSPGRKQDPGEKFPWALLAASGVGEFVPPAKIVAGPHMTVGASGENVRALQQALASVGYDIPASGIYDFATVEIVTAFQRHFRPELIDGIADVSTVTTLKNLLAARSIDTSPTTWPLPTGYPSQRASVGRTAALAGAERLRGRKVRAPQTNGAG
jgi:N-acetylmuramoyl-L-alanine amidase